jgi:hypothetical protein
MAPVSFHGAQNNITVALGQDYEICSGLQVMTLTNSLGDYQLAFH